MINTPRREKWIHKQSTNSSKASGPRQVPSMANTRTTGGRCRPWPVRAFPETNRGRRPNLRFRRTRGPGMPFGPLGLPKPEPGQWRRRTTYYGPGRGSAPTRGRGPSGRVERGGRGGKLMCGACSGKGLAADRSRRRCPHTICYRCHHNGHVGITSLNRTGN